MEKFTCPSCDRKIVAPIIKWSPSHPDGWLDCPYCKARLAINRKSSLQHLAFVVGLVASIASARFIWDDSLLWRSAGGLGMAIFAAALIYSGAKSLAVIKDRDM